MINTYSYYVVKGESNFPLHIVEINHIMSSSFSVFSNAKDAREYIEEQKKTLNKYAPLSYDSEMSPCKNLLKIYKSCVYGMFSKIENHQIYIN